MRRRRGLNCGARRITVARVLLRLDADCDESCGSDLQPESPLYVGAPGGLVAADHDVLDKAEGGELGREVPGGGALEVFGWGEEVILPLGCGREDDQLGIGKLGHDGDPRFE